MFDLGALLALIGQNPQMASELDAAGIPPPNPAMLAGGTMGSPGALGGQMPGMMKLGGPNPAELIPGVESPGTSQAPFDTQVNPEPQGQMTPTAAQAQPPAKDDPRLALAALSGLSALKAPGPPQGTMGVSGGVRLPESKPMQGPQGAMQLMQMLLGGQGGTRQPDLGSLMRR